MLYTQLLLYLFSDTTGVPGPDGMLFVFLLSFGSPLILPYIWREWKMKDVAL